MCREGEPVSLSPVAAVTQPGPPRPSQALQDTLRLFATQGALAGLLGKKEKAGLLGPKHQCGIYLVRLWEECRALAVPGMRLSLKRCG